MPHGCNSLAFAFQEFSGRSDRSAHGGVSGLHRTLRSQLAPARAGGGRLALRDQGRRLPRTGTRARRQRGRLFSTGLNWTEQFRDIVEAVERLKLRQAIFEGEAVAYGAKGIPDFQALRRELGKNRLGRLRYHAFDLLRLDGYDLRNVAYVERKKLLAQVLAGAAEKLI